MSTRPELTHLLWLDLETTGADDQADEIIEIGMILTDLDLDEIDELCTIVRPSHEAFCRLAENEYLRDMHGDNGLLYACIGDDACPISEADEEVCAWLDVHGVQPQAVAVAGSGVGHFDTRFIARQMPMLAARVTYYPVDIGNLRRSYRFATGSDLAPGINDAKPHRALDDVRLHLTEARAFWEAFRRMATAA